MAVASLDYRQFTMGSKAEREAFARTLHTSFERTGFAKLHSHTFSEEEVEKLFMWSQGTTKWS
ncbi:uncharacterized protein BO95DRAFT_469475 [Aspergillus brunneoviolaceus CBS 621.78]|uniref:Uncharacterized protein n=1 Tax=Aspergillus brunneoviolaceus CBS 621.78 TaxID=1450534 RepID=A0ACD1FRY5_9EURO|nr:hypothetical protein BO95DRAFT_469475 [Aspergillus brunneoviolaceus CBS 621.78]RAH39705.1 hypothetical protein BO95DRAFT_469475 [Aspergillus brunneoviolaceus CBS 621.78]